MILTETDYEILARQINMSVSVLRPSVQRGKPIEVDALTQQAALNPTRDVQPVQDLDHCLRA